MTNFQAGVSRVNITPPVGMYLVGMERMENSHGFRDDLFATALAMSDGTQEAVILSLDVLVMHPEVVGRIRNEASALTGIPPSNIMFCATHCHSGPVTYALPDSRPMFRAYVENLIFLLIGAIRMAHDRLEPAVIGFGRGESHIGINRRLTRPDGTTVIAANPEGPVDTEVGILRVDSVSGKPIAVVVNYACHPVVLGNGSNVISADWVGAMRRVVEAVTGAKVLFIQGAGADINPWPGVPCDREEVLERLGMEIGGEVVSRWPGIEPKPVETISANQRKLWLPLLPISEFEGKLPTFVELAESVGGMSLEQLQAWLQEYMPWTVELRREGDRAEVAMELQLIRMDDIALVAAAGEIFVKTGLAIKSRSPIPNTMFAGYTNGAVGYIPLPEDYRRGGYEVYESYLGYRLPAPVAPEASGLLEQSALELLNLAK